MAKRETKEKKEEKERELGQVGDEKGWEKWPRNGWSWQEKMEVRGALG